MTKWEGSTYINSSALNTHGIALGELLCGHLELSRHRDGLASSEARIVHLHLSVALRVGHVNGSRHGEVVLTKYPTKESKLRV
jgi:hypothetical protein